MCMHEGAVSAVQAELAGWCLQGSFRGRNNPVASLSRNASQIGAKSYIFARDNSRQDSEDQVRPAATQPHTNRLQVCRALHHWEPSA